MTTFAPSRKRVFVPTDFDPADWAQLEPQLQSLLDRELDSGDAVNQWLKDASELTAVVGEAGARRSINHACHTDDPAIEKAYFYFPTDPGYRDTSRMLVESGLALSLQSSELSRGGKGGVLTPAACQGMVLLKRLEDSGSTFRWE